MTAALRTLGWRWWAGVLSVAILSRVLVAFAWLGGMPMVSDANDYYAMAVKLAARDFGGAFYWPIGESVFLAAPFAVFGPSLAVARLATIATSLACVVLTALVACELGGAPAGRAAGWIAAGYAPSVLLCGQTYSQHLAALCLVGLAYFGLRAIRTGRVGLFLGAGTALGVGCLTRPSMVSVVPVLIVAWAMAARARRSSLARLSIGGAAALAVALACTLPVAAHNALAGAGASLSTNNERNLFLGNNPYTPDYATSHLGQRSLAQLAPEPRAYLESFYRRTDARSAMRREAVDYAAAHPLRTAWRTVNRTLSFWGFDYLASREIQKWFGWRSLTTAPLLALEAGSYCAVAALVIVALFILKGAGDGLCLETPESSGRASMGWRTWLVSLALAYELPYSLAFSGGTYHFPVVPLLVPIAALAVAALLQLVDGRPRAGVPPPGSATPRAPSAKARWRGAVALCVFAAVQAQYAYYAAVMSG